MENLTVSKIEVVLDESKAKREIGKYNSTFPLKDVNYLATTVETENRVTHLNFLKYTELCWSQHYGVIIKPDYIWQVLMFEIGSHIKADPEKFRHLFTDSDEKKTIKILTNDVTRISINEIVKQLIGLVPFDGTLFMPEFTTGTDMSKLAFGAAFADAMSPYYNYVTFMCNIPAVRLMGDVEDWTLLKENFNKIAEAVDLSDYAQRVNEKVLDNLIAQYDKVDEKFLCDIFRNDRCGSGHDLIRGWVTELFINPVKSGHSSNFDSCVSDVEYKNLETGRKFVMKVGLFSSELIDEYFLEPEFGYAIYEV